MNLRQGIRTRLLLNLSGLTAVSLLLYWIGAVVNRSLQFSYLPTNLFLAWLPLVAVGVLFRLLRTRRWSDWLPFGVSVVWLLLLPNSFYVISDFVHIRDVPRHNLLYDVVMFASFALTAALLGFVSLYLMHVRLRTHLGLKRSSGIVGGILLLCSFAIYLGRDLRWNSWDVVFNPAGLLFDISDHFLHPLQNIAMFTTTATFFILLGSTYIVGWQVAEALRKAA